MQEYKDHIARSLQDIKKNLSVGTERSQIKGNRLGEEIPDVVLSPDHSMSRKLMTEDAQETSATDLTEVLFINGGVIQSYDKDGHPVLNRPTEKSGDQSVCWKQLRS